MTKNIHDQRILILDFGSQYTQLVARRIREIGVYCELWSWDVEEADIREFNPDGIILSGGPESVTEENSPRAPQYVFDSGVPVFGICYGMQTMAEQLGGKVATKYYGVQFHPEVTHTKNGMKMLENFVLNVCGCEGLWTSASIIEDAVARIKEQVGDDEVILGLSGGVDSSVVAMLAHRAIGDKLTCVFVDNGLLRLNEAEQVMDMFGNKFGLNIIHVNAEDRFLEALKGENDPEAKRKIIGHVFVDIFDEESKKLKNAKWLAQGTIYPDVI
ncbi:gamma-glutamyl-gamma-aminobutyrate hydrolase family protein, partial [Vibrio fortis]